MIQSRSDSDSDSDGLSAFDDRDLSRNTIHLVLCYLIVFLSGAAALVYEISWSRQIGLLFGHTVQAGAVVLAAYFTGMAVGYLIGAKLSQRVRPMLGYGVAELLVAGWACVIPTLLRWSESPAIAVSLSNASPSLQTLSRVAFCFFLLLPATTALGVTLPMIAEFLSSRQNRATSDTTIAAARISLAYALNTTGALLGVMSATFYLLVVVGVRTSGYAAAAVSASCAAAALLFSKCTERRECHWNRQNAVCLGSPTTKLDSGCWLMLATFSGFGALALQVLYTRMFSLVFHNSSYTFGAVIAVFLGALALGAAIESRLQRRHFNRTELIAGYAAGLGAIATIISVCVFVMLTELEYFTFGESFLLYLCGAMLLVVVVVGPPITLFGMLLPLSWKNAAFGENAGKVVGRLTAANTFAAAVGALAASFLMLPWLGLWPSFVFLGAVFFLTGCVFLARNGHAKFAMVGAAIFISLSTLTLHSPTEVSSGERMDGEQLVRRWNSPYGWIDVVRLENGSFKVRQNLHYRFGVTGDNAREFRQAHIPLLLHEHPQDVLFLGLGTGLTAGGAIPHSEVNTIVIVELIPEVVEAAELLADYNNGVVEHPKVEVRVDDARHFLLATDRSFDVIISDLFVPWESESGYLYTVEHYQVARQRLKTGGLFCQWLPLYQVSPREFELIANSFASVFPKTTIWWGDMNIDKPVIALVGSDRPIEMDSDQFDARVAKLQLSSESSSNLLGTTEQFYQHYQGDWSPRELAQLNTDEHPRVEFLTPISNRDHKMIWGGTLLDYFDEVISQLPMRNAKLKGDEQMSVTTKHQHRVWQRFILSGGTESEE